MAARTLRQNLLHQRQIAQQAGAAVAFHDLVHRAAEIDVDNVEAQILADLGGVGHDVRVGAEKLRRDGVLLGLEREVAERARGFLVRTVARAHAIDYAMRAGEFGHHQSAAALVADQAAENGVGNAGHGRQHGRGRDADAADAEFTGETRHS